MAQEEEVAEMEHDGGDDDAGGVEDNESEFGGNARSIGDGHSFLGDDETSRQGLLDEEEDEDDEVDRDAAGKMMGQN